MIISVFTNVLTNVCIAAEAILAWLFIIIGALLPSNNVTPNVESRRAFVSDVRKFETSNVGYYKENPHCDSAYSRKNGTQFLTEFCQNFKRKHVETSLTSSPRQSSSIGGLVTGYHPQDDPTSPKRLSLWRYFCNLRLGLVSSVDDIHHRPIGLFLAAIRSNVVVVSYSFSEVPYAYHGTSDIELSGDSYITRHPNIAPGKSSNYRDRLICPISSEYADIHPLDYFPNLWQFLKRLGIDTNVMKSKLISYRYQVIRPKRTVMSPIYDTCVLVPEALHCVGNIIKTMILISGLFLGTFGHIMIAIIMILPSKSNRPDYGIIPTSIFRDAEICKVGTGNGDIYFATTSFCGLEYASCLGAGSRLYAPLNLVRLCMDGVLSNAVIHNRINNFLAQTTGTSSTMMNKAEHISYANDLRENISSLRIGGLIIVGRFPQQLTAAFNLPQKPGQLSLNNLDYSLCPNTCAIGPALRRLHRMPLGDPILMYYFLVKGEHLDPKVPPHNAVWNFYSSALPNNNAGTISDTLDRRYTNAGTPITSTLDHAILLQAIEMSFTSTGHLVMPNIDEIRENCNKPDRLVLDQMDASFQDEVNKMFIKREMTDKFKARLIYNLSNVLYTHGSALGQPLAALLKEQPWYGAVEPTLLTERMAMVLDNPNCRSVDGTSYDGSQNATTHGLVRTAVCELFNEWSDDFLDEVDAATELTIRHRVNETKFTIFTAFMRASGEATTSVFNSILNRVVYVYSCLIVHGEELTRSHYLDYNMVMGDDSVGRYDAEMISVINSTFGLKFEFENTHMPEVLTFAGMDWFQHKGVVYSSRNVKRFLMGISKPIAHGAYLRDHILSIIDNGIVTSLCHPVIFAFVLCFQKCLKVDPLHSSPHTDFWVSGVRVNDMDLVKSLKSSAIEKARSTFFEENNVVRSTFLQLAALQLGMDGCSKLNKLIEDLSQVERLQDLRDNKFCVELEFNAEKLTPTVGLMDSAPPLPVPTPSVTATPSKNKRRKDNRKARDTTVKKKNEAWKKPPNWAFTKAKKTSTKESSGSPGASIKQ